jgi:hypothetical protein
MAAFDVSVACCPADVSYWHFATISALLRHISGRLECLLAGEDRQ